MQLRLLLLLLLLLSLHLHLHLHLQLQMAERGEMNRETQGLTVSSYQPEKTGGRPHIPKKKSKD